MSVLTCDGRQVGDPITNASHIADGYCFHDVFHLSYAAVLGWSPVMRSLLKRKRRSDPDTDEAEDGGRAIAIEEGISALVFAYASRHNYLDGKNHVDNDVLDTIQGMVAHLEVGAHRAADWEKAIITGFAAWRRLRRRGGGTVRLDLDTQTLTVVDPDPQPHAGETPDGRDLQDRGRRPAPPQGRLIRRLVEAPRRTDLNHGEHRAQGRPAQHRRRHAGSTADENILDTAVDLYVYALKYLTSSPTSTPTSCPTSSPTRTDGPTRPGATAPTASSASSTSPTSRPRPGVDAYRPNPRRRPSRPYFADLERCFTAQDGIPAPATTRAQLATELADQALRLVSVIRTTHPHLYAEFLKIWPPEPQL